MPHLDQDGDVSILYLNDPGIQDSENQFHPDWITAVNALLDELEATAGPRALVTTAHGKYYSTGADLTWCGQNPGEIDWYLGEVQVLLARLLLLPMPTVAALQGHTFGAGAFLATTHDHKVMRADRGFFCFPGITIGASYTPGTLSLVSARLAPRAAHESLVTGRRYGGSDALALGLVDDVAGDGAVLERAVDHARGLIHTRGPVLGEIKRKLYEQAVAGLLTPVTGYSR
ncbi:enoyl-CoA hydratase/isomerase family protein [Antrihabitans sp. YC2-6]|uniref:enoyl-CoA hydratase/isomerase family protein n=1 Tax=Antrihabitans sp. YC2-6 TaxID=2799498 RepID=UPI0018F494C4|nr:enoyl-CoA hydratase/isomerase family protein [Antrihabitans sp. YC2-6]MBJ8345570.1 enoyl-CoA hydratase/isomerase family protein [Antrihabitans sp. YC2-6]